MGGPNGDDDATRASDGIGDQVKGLICMYGQHGEER